MSSHPGSTSGSGPPRQRSREASHDDFPSLPSPRLPPLRNVHAPRDRQAPPSQMRAWATAARRADRIQRMALEQAASPGDVDNSDQSPSALLPSSRRGLRLRAVDSRRPAFEDPAQSMQVEAANVELSSYMFDIMLGRASLSHSPLRQDECSDDHRRSKRRKLAPDRLMPAFNGFRYGKYGQVEPGQLRMEIVSCDGGMFSNESLYAADNVLKNDNSVYCTKGNRCNIVLRHHGATVFTLRELVIKAPGSMNYSHPVREGMVFISMHQDDLLSRTAQYQIQYGPASRDRRANPSAPERDLRIISIRHYDDGTASTHTNRTFVCRDDSEEPHRTPQMPQEFARNQPDFQVTTECSDEEDNASELPEPPRRAPNHIGSLPFEANDSDSDSGIERLESNRVYSATQYPRRLSDSLPPVLPYEPINLSLAEALDAHAQATQEAVRAVGGELLVPHARFFIEKKKNKCTIRFEPPVSGRFVLLKMWSSQQDQSSNIDIQSIMARGYAGPRYFPSVQLS
ncbi:hypothetical protein CDD82_3811 [Ophiocordyceps australis]|uniref:Eukaryotic translation initiation factor 6 n=1 Tax=Ophiocordyceps australis TaxID=1399860 RepID=A0A2C5ZRL5_9HYPO|nr:hypothetical protein CDD82_3811 [Ophiocordyceps australis]